MSHVRSLLTRIGYDITTAEDGQQALQLLNSPDAPSLAVLDLEIPGLGGIGICRALRNSKQRRYTYIILLSRWDQKNERIEGLEAGADDCLMKPVDPRELRVRLQAGSQTILEHALRESEEKFRSAFECAGIGMAVVRVTGDFLKINRALCDFLGYTATELQTMNLRSVTHPEDNPTCSDLLDLFLAGERTSGEFEKRFLTKAGVTAWASFTISTVADGDARASSFVIQVQDITARKQAEDALRRKEEFLSAITNNVNDLIFVVSSEHRYVYVSPSHLRGLGYEPGELIGKYSTELVHPEDQPAVERAAIEVIQSGQNKIVAVRMRHKDGSWRHLEGYGGPLRNSAGEVAGILVVSRFIDDRILAEQQLQAAHAETELFLQSIPSILIGLGPQGHITRWNLTAAKTFGLDGQSLKGRQIDDCGIKWLKPEMKSEIANWLRTETTARCDDLTFERDGKPRYLGLHIRRISQEDNACAGFILTGADITERKALEDQLRQAQKLEAIGQLAAGVAHEINTPNQFVGDNVRFLQDSWEDIAEMIRLSHRMQSEAEKNGMAFPELLSSLRQLCTRCDFNYLLQEVPRAMEQSLDGLQRVSKIVRAIKEFSHPGSQEKHAIDINRAIETTLVVAKNEWKYVAEVETELDQTLPQVPCLEGEFNQVILNLVVNAAHAIADVVGKNSTGTSKGKITIITQREDGWARIAVRDTGKGIPKEIRSRVFEPFFTTKPVGQGTGQGLALTHAVIVNRHQGQIWFDSEVDQGTTFHIRIPLQAHNEIPNESAEHTHEHERKHSAGG